LPDNASVLFCPIGDSAYVGTIAEQDKKFDVVIVDAEEQVKCMLNAADFLTDRGVIILDDAARPVYREGVEGLLSRGTA
jgi:predicted O-methyltransferase YrrM